MASSPKFRKAFASEMIDFRLFFFSCRLQSDCFLSLRVTSCSCAFVELGAERRSHLMQNDREAKGMSDFSSQCRTGAFCNFLPML